MMCGIYFRIIDSKIIIVIKLVIYIFSSYELTDIAFVLLIYRDQGYILQGYLK